MKFDLKQYIQNYGYYDVDEFKRQYNGKLIKCPYHNDKTPSAQVNQTNIYCHACHENFFFQENDKQYQTNQEKLSSYKKSLISAFNNQNSEIHKYLKKRNISKYLIEEFGLGYHNNKLILPIKTINNKVVGFGERSLDENSSSKYKNSENSDIFIKGNNLYGINKVTSECEHLIICEGYICVLSAFKHGFKGKVCFVAMMTSKIHEKHIPLIKHLVRKRYPKIKKVSLMLDNDESGKNGTISSIKILAKNNIYTNIIQYKTIDLGCEGEPCKDIDEILSKEGGKENLQQLIDNSTDFFEYLIRNDSYQSCIEVVNSIADSKKRKDCAIRLCRRNRSNTYDHRKELSYHYKNILCYNSQEARKYFLDENQYSSIQLPKYFQFTEVLKWAQKEVTQLNKSDKQWCSHYKKIEKANYELWTNKDGEYAWRKMQVINPLLYVELVNIITENANWEQISQYFIQKPQNIKCCSLPVKDEDRFKNNTARQIMEWWTNVEQESIKQSMKYKYLIHTDIVDCYGSIYTHTIPWALHDKENAKQDKNKKELLGSKIDDLLQCLSHGQTNGIPQGSVLMDFVAEILLHRIDLDIEAELKNDDKITDYYIIRYRDDYRIFSNEIETCKQVIKVLSKTLIKYGGMRLSSDKTKVSECVISGAIKKDKIYYCENFQKDKSLRENALNMYIFSRNFSNSGAMMKFLKSFKTKLLDEIGNVSVSLLNHNNSVYDDYRIDTEYIISILTNIMYYNTKFYPPICDIIYELLSITAEDKRLQITKEIREKIKDIPHTEFLNIWLERMVYIDNDNVDDWYEHYKHIEENKTLFYKGYINRDIWSFKDSYTNTPSIITEEVRDSLSKAEIKEIQEVEVNENIYGRFGEDEVDYFSRY